MAVTTSHNADADKIRARISGKLDKYFPESGNELPTLELAAVSHRSYSDLYLFRTSVSGRDGATGLAVKVFLPSSGGQDAARLQYAALTSVWPAFRASETLAIPRPLDYFPELSAIVTERIDGEPLQRLFRTVALLPGQRARLVRLTECAGQWLRKFHSATAFPAGPLDVASKLESLGPNLRLLHASGFSADLCRQLEILLESLAKNVRDIELDMASVHGDFTVDNVLCDRKRVITIDLGGRDRNAIYHDIATFLNSLALIGLSWPVPRSLVEHSSRGFLSGYFGAGEYCGGAVNFLRLLGLVSVALEMSQRRKAQSLLRWRIRRYVGRLFRTLIQDANG